MNAINFFIKTFYVRNVKGDESQLNFNWLLIKCVFSNYAAKLVHLNQSLTKVE